MVSWSEVGRGLEGYFATVDGRGWEERRILDSAVKVGTLGLGDVSEVVFHRRLCTGEWTCSNCGKTDCWSTRYSCYRCGVLRYFDGSGMGQGHFSVLVQAKVGAGQASRDKGLGLR